MYMTHNAKSLSQGLWEFPKNENRTFLAICGHQSLTAAGIIEVTLVLMPSFLSYAVYGDTMWSQAGRQTTSTAAHPQGHFLGWLRGQYHQTCHSEMPSKMLPTNPHQWSPERWLGTPCTSLEGAPCLWPIANTQFQCLDRFVRDCVTFAHICHPPLPWSLHTVPAGGWSSWHHTDQVCPMMQIAS